ncbi:BEL1-like homeodomain protein 8 [Prosopis cineraria]|uniref:BEL1-like homeodomain protein 8 n=1 Tax=Prosopis cineraria TaxID=364024 RepID=UPI00240EB7AD|nr:BEL1-like homeodomain protein 8 [Prosopis cineraria]XP_054815698.1 BEL1-like homeodomain protein 8 [Prosopis cineraria]XP_054815699.1 BEL1-like homeodomain protein 8 [Prosopis cineraria]XP_054815700.1 BEL1-like homeodomain protein 8 [Prosopis cineraria]
MSSLRPESHVAQQIRRDKLRIQNSSQHLQDFPTNIEQLSLHPGLNSDFLQVRNVRNANMLYEPAFYSSEMANFSTPSNPLSAGDEVKPSRLMLPHYASFPRSSVPEQGPSSADQPRVNLGYDWMINYGSSSGVNETNNPSSSYATELNNNNAPVCQHLGKPSYNELMGRQLGDEVHHPSFLPPLFQNTLHDIVKSASIGAQGSTDHIASQMQHPGHGIWMGNQSQSNLFHFGNTNLSDSINPQGLSLSLSSNSHSKASLAGFPFRDGHGSDELYSRCDKSAKSVVKPSSLVTKNCGKSLQDVVGVASNASGYRSNVGPLGPFTGYATILKSSRFLKPAQELLDEFCNMCGSNVIKASDVSDISRLSGEASAYSAAEAVISATKSGVSAKGSVSNAGAASCSILFHSDENSGACEARGNFDYSSLSAYQQKKSKLLYMQEEVTKKHKQYHQQMHMVVSSFESVAGLSSASPYITMALKSITRHFKCLKNAILDQIKHTREVLGEELSGSTSGSTSKLDTGLTYLEQSFQKNKASFLEPQQVWRPQRGLPERAVAILKAWLFEHFLHPYPTDTDKHMLATQTGLSRNQVSNWFINARVRVWKPMVEEIHNLETKGFAGGNQNEGASGAEGSSQQAMVAEPLGKFGRHGDVMPEKQFQCLEMSPLGGNPEGVGFMGAAEQWNQEKRSKLECQITPNMDGALMGFVPYRRDAGLDVGGLGSVSLTLGLRHGIEAVQHQQQQQLHQEDQIRHHFGEHMIHDFVG